MRRGPTDILSHPNYAVVAGEIALLPLALHLPLLALIFTVLNAAVLVIRIRAEARALSAIGGRLARPVHERPAGAAAGDPDVTPSVGTWAGFLLMCLGMFMAILDIQVVATSLPTIQHALAISPDAMSWIQTAYLIAEVDRDPADRPVHARPDLAVAVRRSGGALYRSPRSAAPSAAALPCCSCSAWCRDFPAAC